MATTNEMSKGSEREQEVNILAETAIRTVQDRIITRMRFLDSAIFALQPVNRKDSYGLRTDGVHFFYEPYSVLRRCRHGLEQMSHDYLHLLFHCVFLHNRVPQGIEPDLWDLAADIAVEDVIDSIRGGSMEDEFPKRKREELQRLRNVTGELTAERLCHYFEKIHIRRLRVEQLTAIFHVDEHEDWYDQNTLPLMDRDQEDGGEQQEMEMIEPGEPRRGSDTEKKDDQEDSEEPDWEQIAEYIQQAVDQGASESGEGSETLLNALRNTDEKLVTYDEFLRRFARRKEVMRVDDASYDPIFYTYGLELYHDMPLIEPLESREEKQVHDLVIVIDSSASTSGEQVRSFVQRTFEILQNEEVLSWRFHIRLIQCDDQIREDVVLHSREEAQDYLGTIRIKGQGSTDFRVAFRYVEELQKRGAFTRLKGLVYFTDGKGIFPRKKPPYETAFVFTDPFSAAGITVPVWALKTVLEDRREREL